MNNAYLERALDRLRSAEERMKTAEERLRSFIERLERQYSPQERTENKRLLDDLRLVMVDTRKCLSKQ